MPVKFNAHTHCFTLGHVPEDFFLAFGPLGKFLRISRLRKKDSLNNAFVWVITRRWFIGMVGLFSKMRAGDLKRLKGLLQFEHVPEQCQMIDILSKSYRDEFSFVLLTMDMDEMGAGIAEMPYEKQLKKLQDVKGDRRYTDRVFPFVFADPRRNDVAALVKEHIDHAGAPFAGIKIYPAIGYYPFDKGMKEVYEFAVNKNIPLMTHCIEGVVYYRKELQHDVNYASHPVTGKASLKGSPSVFQLNFTHPLNYECLLNHEILKRHWGENAPNLRSLKLCIGHFGGRNEWALHDRQQRMIARPRYDHLLKFHADPLDITQPWFGSSGQRLNWFAIIVALLKKYKNLYADISFTLAEDGFQFKMLKQLLQDNTINRRILFGTDFYVVSTIKQEDTMLQLLKDNLDQTEIDMLTISNPADFLNPQVNNYS